MFLIVTDEPKKLYKPERFSAPDSHACGFFSSAVSLRLRENPRYVGSGRMLRDIPCVLAVRWRARMKPGGGRHHEFYEGSDRGGSY
jgi:hypothetical protein